MFFFVCVFCQGGFSPVALFSSWSSAKLSKEWFLSSKLYNDILSFLFTFVHEKKGIFFVWCWYFTVLVFWGIRSMFIIWTFISFVHSFMYKHHMMIFFTVSKNVWHGFYFREGRKRIAGWSIPYWFIPLE